MSMGQAIQGESILRRRYEEYKSDPAIKQFELAIGRELEKARPFMKVDMDTMEVEHCIDETTMSRIAFLKGQLTNYIESSYPDLFRNK